jgi:hypothetical protein
MHLRISLTIRYALGLWAVVSMVAGCSGDISQPAPGQQSQSQLSSTIRQRLSMLPSPGFVVAPHRDLRRSWISPDAKAKDLLYVSDQNNAEVDVFSYPKGALKGTLTGFSQPLGECVDKAQDVFVADFGAGVVFEFAHGGTSPVQILYDPGGSPLSCAVDPTTGNLAVSNIFGVGSAPGNVEIYANASGTPTMYVNQAVPILYFCGYDNKGNLFVDGLGNSDNFLFEELPSGSGTFTNITLNQSIAPPGGVQWDGKYVAVLDSGSTIYRFKVSGSAGEAKKSPVNLSDGYEVNQFWKQGNLVSGGNSEADPSVHIWNYPAGGDPVVTIPPPYPSQIFSPVGVTVSKGK